MSNYRNGRQRPMWRGGTPGRETTKYEEKVFGELPFFDGRKERWPKASELGYFLTGMEEEGPSRMQPFSDKYLKVHDRKYQPRTLRLRKEKRYENYSGTYPEGTELPKTTTIEEAEKTTCVFYPDQPNLILKAPLTLADPQYAERRNNECPPDPNGGNALFDLLVTVPTLGEQILKEAGYLGIAALTQSSKRGLETVSSMKCFFDIATGDFANTEYTVTEYEALSLCGQARMNDVPHGYRVVQVSSGHLGYDPKTFFQRPPGYENLAKGVVRLTRSFQLWGKHIEHLYLTKVPFMDVKVLGMWLKEMPKLKTLTVLRCEHIRMFDMVPLLDMVHNHRKSGSELKLDVAPFYERGPKWANFEGDPRSFDKALEPTRERKGTFGVTFADPGVKIHAAVVEFLFYELLPKLEATDQMYLMSLDSLLRHFFERLPLPQHAILRTIKAYEGARKWFNKVEAHLLAEALAAGALEPEAQETEERKPETQQSDQGVKRPEFPDPFSLPKELRMEEARERIRCYTLLAYAAFGDEDPHLQTLADSSMSSNAPFRHCTFGKWGEDVACSSCHIRMPCMFFPTACLCDKDRLHAVCMGERDHYKQRKKLVIEKLGCGYTDEPAKALEETNIDFTALRSLSHASPQLPSDFDEALDNPDSALYEFYQEARSMDVKDPTGQFGQLGMAQPFHPYSGMSLAKVIVHDQMEFHSYRRGYTVEDFTKHKRGFNARNTAHESRF